MRAIDSIWCMKVDISWGGIEGMDNVAVSQYFQVADTVLWNPSAGVARLFARNVEAVAPAVGLPTGLGPEFNDEYQIDMITFTAFVDALVHRYYSSTHLILRTLIEGVVAVGVVLVERAGGTIPTLGEPPAAIDPNDVTISTNGFGAVGDATRLRDLVDEFERTMPR
jgi:hypothetical protein